ncbi:hypothetical protein SAMN04490357_0982 [Streptomyces misionensis]|uniref:Uncharacterized protein n=1 Tax=Streptomyces misionensis TaxID=67331 RepID=A0A1H4P3V1_9ACTN|nr:hypothetical protein [Streptomyces misionensis]SEC02131.1 hypothetical protein SAMN04490357_0982 [Streptomyces misionensis]
MSARRHLVATLTEGQPGKTSSLQDIAHAEQLVNAVIAERDAEIMRWLGKKAREYRATGSRQHALQADTIELMASKISRGAVRPDNTRLPAGGTPTFFEPGRTYTTDRWTFRCETTGPSPTTNERRALGWMHKPGYGWYPTALDPDDWEHGGWTESSEGGEVR